MGYQALLFCPDEKTARTVTQVLSELDFEVFPCTEPFAAVKKLMGEHFDAVVVDCDNEQNATLLFKSARNSPNNQSALAVAVVEGQAGVAKAFRIGANLVLTKPINVEQAKGTLRVARGLLRKNEGAKAQAITTTPKPASSAPPSAKPTLVPSPGVPRPTSVVSPIPATSAPPQKVAPKPGFAASAPSVVAASGEPKESVGAAVPQTTSPSISSIAAFEANQNVPFGKRESLVSMNGVSPVSSTGAASAAAPAREVASIAAPEKPTTLEPEAEISTGKNNAAMESSSVTETVSPAPSFTFGGAVESGTKSTSGGSKKTLLALVAIVLIAASAYVGWTQFSRPNGATNISGQLSAKPAASAISQPAPSTTSIAPSDQSAATSAIPASTVAAHSSGSAKPSPTAQINLDASTATDRKTSVAESSKPVAPVVAENKGPTVTPGPQPIVVKPSAGEPTLRKSALSEAPAPSLNVIASGGNGATLPNLLGNPNSSPTPVLQTLNVSQGVSQGLAIKKTPPSYPANALRMGIEGSVQLLATISKKGDISAVKVLSGDPSLARAATDAVKQWKYKPYLLDGVPVEIQTQVTVNFKLPR
ncbi:MAG: TonB family protein [Candidatus Sulfotelmatobacter sp.]